MKHRHDQPDLFADYKPDAPFVQGSETSRESAREIAPKAETLRLAVLDYIRSRGEEGATDEETQYALEMPGSTQRPRRVELVDAGLIRDSGKKRKTLSGREAVVWVVQQATSGKVG